ncbi:signal peptide peptidase SppA [Microvirga sp. 17 mud 1-3]|uniref:signal peptide peptidase SppA n=1 Tax=Microvirga sp. 17 mud 1-3 TaxID=2082949 RepID=UPI000D6BB31E|nr:signal peptide peptidase SppA [Microvirga sp. 17 mud 1-3]AWM88705.1 signal peptide peptidase SppA [Microvirga sp. 17 mud 1-3]
MPIDAEAIADRRRLRRKISFWRVVGVLALIAAIVAMGYSASDRFGFGAGAQIARISVNGLITGNQRLADLMERVGESAAVSGVVVSINSPGGTTTGSEEIFRNIRRLAEKKPVVAFVDGTAASGAYITAMATDHIVARETALVGSIGVLFQYPDVSGLLDHVGVKVEAIKSAPLKAEPNPFTPTSPEARAAIMQVVNDTYDWFKRLVRERRHMNDAELATVSTGQVFSGHQGVALKLVDAVGTERDAIAWLEREKGVRRNLPVRDWKPRGDRDLSIFALAAAGADLAGLENLAGALRRSADGMAAARLDGLLALWHPSEK